MVVLYFLANIKLPQNTQYSDLQYYKTKKGMVSNYFTLLENNTALF